MSDTTPKKLPFKRVLLKVTGEAFVAKPGNHGIEVDALNHLAMEIKGVRDLGLQMAVTVGGGNIFRGAMAVEAGMDRVSADYMGMLATMINGLALQNALEQIDVDTRVLTSIDVHQLAEPYVRRRAMRHLEKGRVVIFAGGTGNPYFTTDTTASLRAMEINAEVILKATKVDGVYDADPMKDSSARKYTELKFIDVLKNNLKVMDAAAISLCMDNQVPIIVFNMTVPGNIKRVLTGEKIGTIVRGFKAMSTDTVFAEINGKMDKTISSLARELAGVRTGRANTGLLDGITVDYYGTETPLTGVASVTVPDALTLGITPWEKSMLGLIEKAIQASDLGLNPNNDGTMIRINMPPLTEERRRDLTRHVKKICEESKVAARNVRRDGMDQIKKLEKEKAISEDDAKRGGEKIQKILDEHIAKIDKMLAEKEKEIMDR